MKRGAAFELHLEIMHREYQRKGLAWVKKTEPSYKMVAGKWVPVGKGQPDFVGGIARRYARSTDDSDVQYLQTVVFDAKECATGDRFPFAKLPVHQAQALTDVAKMGGLAFVAVRFKEAGEDMVYDWAACGWAYWQWKTKASATASFERTMGALIPEGGWLSLVGGG